MPIQRKKKSVERDMSLIDFNQPKNSEVFMNELKTLSSAACGVVLVRTKEFHRCAATIFEFAIAKGNTGFRSWMVTAGWRDLPTEPRVVQQIRRPTPVTVNPMDPNGWANVADNGLPDEAEEDEPAVPEHTFDLYPSEEDVQPDNKYDIGGALETLFKYWEMDYKNGTNSKASVNVMFAPDFWLTEPGMQEYLRQATSMSLDMDARLILVCHDSVEIPERLFEEMRILDFLPPNAGELYEMIDDIVQGSEIEGDDGDISLELSEKDRIRIVQNAIGLTANEFSTALSIGIVKQDDTIKEGDDLDVDVIVDTILDSKLEMIKKNPILEYVKPMAMSEVGGLDLLKEWVEDQKVAFSPEAAKFGIDKPRGILVAGIPGSGKSLIAKCMSSVLNIPAFMLDIGKVFGGIVGQSESQMRTTLKLVDAMAPCVLWLDEIDKGFANTSGGGDSGTSARVFGTFLTWMQERKNDEKPVVVMFTANNVDGLPPELLRKGRVDEIFCVSFPSREERVEILEIHAKKRGHKNVSRDAFMEAAGATEKFVGAELEALIKNALHLAYKERAETLTAEHMVEAANKIKPLATTFPERIAKMNNWAKQNAVPASSSYTFDNDNPSPDAPKKHNTGSVVRRIRPMKGKRSSAN